MQQRVGELLLRHWFQQILFANLCSGVTLYCPDEVRTIILKSQLISLFLIASDHLQYVPR